MTTSGSGATERSEAQPSAPADLANGGERARGREGQREREEVCARARESARESRGRNYLGELLNALPSISVWCVLKGVFFFFLPKVSVLQPEPRGDERASIWRGDIRHRS